MDALSLVLETFAPVPGRALIDIGCGPGVMAAALAERGAHVTGIDPGEAAIAAAKERVRAAHFEIASAEALPFADGSFDGAVILNALHHVPDPRAALAEAARVVRGAIVVIEPLAEGSSFSALRPIEDETRIRAAAQSAIAAALADGTFHCIREATFARREAFAGLDAFLDRVCMVDPSRRAAIQQNAVAIADAFARAAERDEAGRFVLMQPLRAHVLVAA